MIVNEYTAVLDRENDEGPIQTFIQENPVLLARFHARRIFWKPSILGTYEVDFAILDTQGRLVLVELEKPSLKLFKKDKHPTQYLNHAYGQVNDWLAEYRKQPDAVLEKFGLTRKDITAVRGAVVAGRSSTVTHEVLQRHLSRPPYSDIDFMTYDDLAASLLDISINIA